MLGDPDRLALSVWELMQSRYVRERGGMALIVELIKTAELSPAEWLGLADRLAVVDEMTSAGTPRQGSDA